jgi:hypothetical protein
VPSTTLLSLALLALLAGALGAWVGGVGGAVLLKVRPLRMRLDQLDDEIEALGRRIARREGEAGQKVKREREASGMPAPLAREVAQLVAAGRQRLQERPPAQLALAPGELTAEQVNALAESDNPNELLNEFRRKGKGA